jgi:hypothetical protein
MSVYLPNGSIISVGSTYGSPITVTAITNAATAVVTAAGHGLADGDYVVVTSGWSRINGKVFRVDGATTNTFELEGLDTTSTVIYPAGSGVGTVKEVTAFVQIPQILTSATNGGEQQFLEYQFLESDAQTRIPTVKSAAGLTLSIGDDPTLPGYAVLSAANDDRDPRAVRVDLSNGSKILYNGYISLNRTPSLTVNELAASEVTISFVNEPVRYQS